MCSEVKYLRYGAEAKASLKGRKLHVVELHVVDPKPDDLTMNRLKRW